MSTERGANKAAGFVFFSERLKQATRCATTIDFTPDVCATIEHELDKVRIGRREAMARVYAEHIRLAIASAPFVALRREATLAYDVAAYPLQAAFATLIGLPADVPLHRLHTLYEP